ncbi:MAG: hypothetical protein IJ137_11520 [Eubacterium sp.]|nr:hypothetical protein [Eubacterium sp.]
MSMNTAAAYDPYGMPILGYMPMPADFPYLELMRQGRPRHDPLSDFGRKHPKMPCARRAKLFAPFDALAGFDERIANKEVLYEERRELSDTEREELDKKISLICQAFKKSRSLHRPAPRITVTYFSPCSDIENDSYSTRGNYITCTGRMRRIDPDLTRTITVDDHMISFNDITDLSVNLSDRVIQDRDIFY